MTGLFISVIIPAKALRIQQLKERRIVMTTIDKAKTGQQIRLLMEKRGVTVRDVKNVLSLACVQSVYHWLDGQSMPTLDNLYALSDLLKVPMDMLVCGNRRYDPKKIFRKVLNASSGITG